MEAWMMLGVDGHENPDGQSVDIVGAGVEYMPPSDMPYAGVMFVHVQFHTGDQKHSVMELHLSNEDGEVKGFRPQFPLVAKRIPGCANRLLKVECRLPRSGDAKFELWINGDFKAEWSIKIRNLKNRGAKHGDED